jgi:hypothetical protein
MVVDGDGEDFFGMGLPDHVLIELSHDFSGGGNPVEEGLGAAAATLLLFQDALAKFDAFTTDVNVPRSFNQRADIAIALATERAEGIFLRGTRPSAPSTQIFSCGHGHSF